MTDGYQFGDPPRGEWGGERTFYRGDPPDELPLPRLVGTKGCIENGMEFVEPREPNGNDATCRLLPPGCYPQIEDIELRTNVEDCRWAVIAGTILKHAYDNLATAEAIARYWFGDAADIRTFPLQNDVRPAMLTVKVEGRLFVFITGTTSFQQLALQALSFANGPINYGEFSAPAFQFVAAVATLERIADQTTPFPRRVQMIGHSYGGSLAAIATTILRVQNKARKLELLTFGTPKSLDDRGREILSPIPQAHWRNEFDPVPFMPPQNIAIGPWWLLLNPALRLSWSSFENYDGVRILLDGGGIAYTARTDLSDDFSVALAMQLVQGDEIEPFATHFMGSYVASIIANCPCAPSAVLPPKLRVRLLDFGWQEGPVAKLFSCDVLCDGPFGGNLWVGAVETGDTEFPNMLVLVTINLNYDLGFVLWEIAILRSNPATPFHTWSLYWQSTGNYARHNEYVDGTIDLFIDSINVNGTINVNGLLQVDPVYPSAMALPSPGAPEAPSYERDCCGGEVLAFDPDGSSVGDEGE